MSTVFLFLGAPGSGKSYFARNLAAKTDTVRLNGDSMRLAIFGSLEGIEQVYFSDSRERVNSYTFGAIDYVVEQLLEKGQDVVYDAHHNKKSIRDGLAELANKHGGRAVTIWIKTPYDVALRRGQEREVAVDQRRLSEEKMREVMDRHLKNLDEPSDDETVVVIDGQTSFDIQYESFLSQLEKLNMSTKKYTQPAVSSNPIGVKQ